MHAILQVELIDLLSAAGCGTIEAASFVSPKWVPQMADGSDVLSKIRRAPGVKYAALTPNLRGLEGALEAGVDEVGALCEQMPCCAVVVVVPAAVATGSLHMYFAVVSQPPIAVVLRYYGNHWRSMVNIDTTPAKRGEKAGIERKVGSGGINATAVNGLGKEHGRPRSKHSACLSELTKRKLLSPDHVPQQIRPRSPAAFHTVP